MLKIRIAKKGLYISNSLPLSPTRSYYWNVLLPIYNNVSEQNYLDKPVFNNVSSLNHSSPMNNTAIKKNKHFPQLLALGPQIELKRNAHYFLSSSTATTKLDTYVYKYKDDYIRKDLLQVEWR